MMEKIFRPLTRLYNKTKPRSLVNMRSESIISSRHVLEEDHFEITRAQPNDSEEILDTMWKAYYPKEPCLKSIGLGSHRNVIFDDYMQEKICKQHTFIARCKHDCSMVGAAINEVINPWDSQKMEKFACTLEDIQMRRLFMFWSYVMRAPCIFERFKINTVFQVSHLFVRKNDRRKGVARKLITASRDYAADSGFSAVRVDCPNAYAANVCERIRMKLIYEIPFRAYIACDDCPVFKTEAPHRALKIFVALPHRVTCKSK